MANFITVKGSASLSETPFYIGIPQHERVMTKDEAYKYVSSKTGHAVATVRSVFQAVAQAVKTYQNKGIMSQLDAIATLRNVVKGGFATQSGPWVKGKNYLLIAAIEADAFKKTLASIIPVNMTGGANPFINTIMDRATSTYDVISGTATFAIAGADLAPDAEATDEGVWLDSAAGVSTKCMMSESSLGYVEAHLATALTPGEYTVRVMTRSGLGEEFGVKSATRKVTVIA